jgi:hypothetical protein
MGIDQHQAKELVGVLVSRGLGVYGRARMEQICYDSGVALLDDDTTDWLGDNIDEIVTQFLINYAKFNLAAKMTAMVLAKKHDVPLPNELKRKVKRKSRFRRLLGR